MHLFTITAAVTTVMLFAALAQESVVISCTKWNGRNAYYCIEGQFDNISGDSISRWFKSHGEQKISLLPIRLLDPESKDLTINLLFDEPYLVNYMGCGGVKIRYPVNISNSYHLDCDSCVKYTSFVPTICCGLCVCIEDGKITFANRDKTFFI